MAQQDRTSVYIGMGGWDLFPFNKYFYPPKPKRGFRKLEFYSQFFDVVEVNATFYNTSLTSAHARQWLRDVAANKDFRFTVKLYKGFTHDFTATKQEVSQIHAMLEPLAGEQKLGGIIIQFPYSFTYRADRCRYLAQLRQIFRPYELFVELRHNSWDFPNCCTFLEELEMHFVNIDLPRMKRHMPFKVVTLNGATYFRMMGRNSASWDNPWRVESDGKHIVSDRYNYLYNAWELEHLAYLIGKVQPASKNVYVIFHNDPEANSLINGFQLRHLVRNKQRVMVPRHFVNIHPMLKPISNSVNIHHPLFAEE